MGIMALLLVDSQRLIDCVTNPRIEPIDGVMVYYWCNGVVDGVMR
jgi:hypothetical protein